MLRFFNNKNKAEIKQQKDNKALIKQLAEDINVDPVELDNFMFDISLSFLLSLYNEKTNDFEEVYKQEHQNHEILKKLAERIAFYYNH